MRLSQTILLTLSMLLYSSSMGMAEQRQTQLSGAALKCKSDARARAKICLTSYRTNPEKARTCATSSQGSFQKCCDRASDPKACKSQTF